MNAILQALKSGRTSARVRAGGLITLSTLGSGCFDDHAVAESAEVTGVASVCGCIANVGSGPATFTAGQTIATIHAIKAALFDYKHRIRAEYKFYSQDLINNLFSHPYTKIDFIHYLAVAHYGYPQVV